MFYVQLFTRKLNGMYRKFLNMLLTNFAIYAYLVSNDLVIFQGPYKCMNETNREVRKTNTKLYKIEREHD